VWYKFGIYHIAQNFGRENFGRSTHPEILVEKTLADGDNKSFLLVCTKLIVAWLHGDASMMSIYTFSVEWFVATPNTKLLVSHGQTLSMQGDIN